MFVRTIKRKVYTSFVLFLTFIIAMGVLPVEVFANGTGGTVGGLGGVSSGSGPLPYEYPSRPQMRSLNVFLFAGDNKEFILTNDNLKELAVDSGAVEGGVDSNANAAYKAQMSGRSITNAYYQIFGRTLIDMSAEEVKNSLVLLGSSHGWTGVGLVEYGSGVVAETRDDVLNRGVWSYGEDGALRYDAVIHGREVELYGSLENITFRFRNYHTSDKGEGLPLPRPVYGSGVFTADIIKYVKDYFMTKTTTETPDKFLSRLVLNATSEQKEKSFNIWSYIANGVIFAESGNDGPYVRWENCFLKGAGREYYHWNETYMGSKRGADAQPGLYTMVNGVPTPIESWDSDPKERAINQIASYLDTLLSMAVLLNSEGLKASVSSETVAKKGYAQFYLDTAIGAFRLPGTDSGNNFVTSPEDMEAVYNVVMGTSLVHNKGGTAHWRIGKITTYIDMWKQYMGRNGATISAGRDIRHLDTRYNDVYIGGYNFALEESESYKNWATTAGGSVDKPSVDRAAMFHSTLASPNVSGRYAAESWEPKFGMGPTSTLTGSYIDTDGRTVKEVYISSGFIFGGEAGTYGGLSNDLKGTMIVGQYVIGMFAHANGSSRLNFTHSISANTKNTVVVPSSETLDNRPTVEYRYGTSFDSYNRATSGVAEIKSVVDTIGALLDENGGDIEMRTYLTRRVTVYKLATLYAPGDPESGGGTGNPIRKELSVSSVPLQETDIVGVPTKLGYVTVPKESFSTANTGYSVVTLSDLNNFLSNYGNVLISYVDNQNPTIASVPWPLVPGPYNDADTSDYESTLYTRGADYILKVEYAADTELRLNYGGGEYFELDYTGRDAETSVVRAKSATGAVVNKMPVVLSEKSDSKLSAVADVADYYYKLDPTKQIIVNKPKMSYAVYSSSPEAYAELKNWGVASRNEPGDETDRGDGTALGDGRAPVDTGAGVSESFRSDGAQLITEDYEAMAGVPSTEKLYLAVGGSEFIVDIAVQYVPNETAVRTYQSKFDGIACQFNYKSLSNEGGDTTADALWTGVQVPQPKNLGAGVTATVTTSANNGSINPHDGGWYTLTIEGVIKNDGEDGLDVTSDHDGGTYNHAYGKGPFEDRDPATSQGSNGSGSQLTASEAAKGNNLPASGTVTRVPNTVHDSPESWSWAVPNVDNVKSFNVMMDTTVKQWIDDMVAYFKAVPEFTAGSDHVSRKLGNGEVGEFTYTKNELLNDIIGYRSFSSDSGSLTVTPPDKLFQFDDGRGAEGTFNVITFETNDVYDATNPTNKSNSASSSCNGVLRVVRYDIKTTSSGQTGSCSGVCKVAVEPDAEGKGGSPATKCSSSKSGYSNSNSWSGSITGKWTDGHDVEWFVDTTEGQAEYASFEAAYQAAQAAADAWVAAESAKSWTGGCGCCGHELGTNVTSASVSSDVFQENATPFRACTASQTVHATKDTDKKWRAQYTFRVQPHILCGPCCNHNLPEINDIWQQSFNYDYLKIIGLSVLRLDQGSAIDDTEDQSGLAALIGVPKLGVTRQTFYSSPSYNIAQANIFNYMGLQTDGTKNVSEATNEYIRSIAYGRNKGVSTSTDGSKTDYGQTYSSEAGRVRYWITNSDGSTITAKGTEVEREIYEGNTEKTAFYANEISPYDSSNGLFNAHDYVLYNFGARSNICDGTSRGYSTNIDKRSWIEKVDGVWRGKAAQELPWGNGFIYDGIRINGIIDMQGYSVSRSYRNSLTTDNTGGIYQNGSKGWKGTGMLVTAIPSVASGVNTVDAYDQKAVDAFSERKWWIQGSMPVVKNPIIRDWNWEVAGEINSGGVVFDGGFHYQYRDTRPLSKSGAGTTWPGAEDGEVAARGWAVYNWEKRWANETGTRPDTLASSVNPYNTDEGFLRAYTNTAHDNGVKNRATSEYELMMAKRTELVQATVISDALIFELPSGNQPIMYHYKNAPSAVRADARVPDTRIPFEDLWTQNPFSAAGWQIGSGDSRKDSIIIGSYNGKLSGTTNTMALQPRFNWRADLVPTNPAGIHFLRNAVSESPTGVIGEQYGALELNGVNINKYMGHNTSTNILFSYVNDEKTVSPMVQGTLLYNVSPIVLSARNDAYAPGKAEAFWETIMQWKDSSNHDYYSMYAYTGNPPHVYMESTQFVRLPELLYNYGDEARDPEKHTKENGLALLESWFVDTRGLEVLGAEQAKDAQSEQYSRGFGITNYNYNDKSLYTTKTTSPEVKVDEKTHAQVYNKSADLTDAALGTPYGTQRLTSKTRQLGIPFILDTVYESDFDSVTAMDTPSQNHIGDLRADTPKSGYIQQAAYLDSEAKTDVYKLNSIIIHTPITARSVQLMPLADWRDQRTFGQSQVSAIRDSMRTGCPGTVSLCQFSILACTYLQSKEYLNLDFTTSGLANSGLSAGYVKNTGTHAVTQGNIQLAGTYKRTDSGLSSGASSVRTGIALSALGVSYSETKNIKVTVTGVSYTATSGSKREQMLFGFAGYGITVDTQTGELYIRIADNNNYLKVNGTISSSSTNTLTVEFGMSNASQSKVWVNGVARSLIPIGNTSSMVIGSGQINNVFYVGAWNSSGYSPESTTYIRTLILEQLDGGTSHTSDCTAEIQKHVGGKNTHVHSVACLGPSSSSSYLSGTLKDWANGLIDDTELKKRLGSSVYYAIQNKLNQTVLVATFEYSPSNAAQLYVVPVSGVYNLEVWGAQGGGNTPYSNSGSRGGAGGYANGEIYLSAGTKLYISVGGKGTIAGNYSAGRAEQAGGQHVYNYTGGQQTFTAPRDGVYTFEVYGAQGGSGKGASGGLGGYSKGTYTLSQGQQVYLYVGGQGKSYTTGNNGDVIQGGYNGGGSGLRVIETNTTTNYCSGCRCACLGCHGYHTSDCGYYDTNYSSVFSNVTGYKLMGHWACPGHGTTTTTVDHSSSSGGGASDIRIGGTTLEKRVIVAGGGGGASGCANWGAAGNGGGTTGGNAYTNIGSNYDTSYSNGGTQWDGGTAYSNYNAWARQGSWGQGADALQCGAGGGGGYYGGGAAYTTQGGGGSGYIGGVSGGTMVSGQKTGNGQIVITAPAVSALPAGYYGTGGGGWNGGGNGYSGSGTALENAGAAGYGGGGATHISTSLRGNGILSDYNSYRGDVLIVAGGGGGADNLGGTVNGADDGSGGHGGGASGTGALINGVEQPSTAGKSNAGGTSGGTFGKGGNATTATDTGGGGGGWFGGGVTNNNNGGGGGGSGYRSTLFTRESTYSNPIKTGIVRSGDNGHGMARITLVRAAVDYNDIVSLEGELWRTIPDYMDAARNERNPVWACSFEANTHVCVNCFTEIDYSGCTEPHHNGLHYEGSSICYQPCMNDNLHDTQFVQDANVNTAAAEWVSIDWDYTLYASSIDSTFKASTKYQLDTLSSNTGRGYYNQNAGGDFDTVKFVRGKYIQFPWYTLYDGVLYSPKDWIVLGDRGTYNTGYVSDDVKEGLYGNMQGSAVGTANVWNGQAAAYNVQNWSLYNQKIYHDLYKDFYDFYIPLANDELNAAQVIYATVAVNAPETFAGAANRNGSKIPTALSSVNTWRSGGRVNNRNRTGYFAYVGASKQFRVDLVGRVGGYVIQDTTDVKFSTTMKDVKQTDDLSTKEFTLDMTNLSNPNTLQSEPTQRLNKTSDLPDRVGLSALGDWVGFEFNAENNRSFTITVTGDLIKSGELSVEVGDSHNGDYIIRMTDMTVVESTDTTLTVQFEVKPSESSIILKVRYRLVEQGVGGVYVDKMSLTYGGAGFSYGLAQNVDSDIQNYYVTDLVDVRGIYISNTVNFKGFPLEGFPASGDNAPVYGSGSPSNPNSWGLLGKYKGSSFSLLEWYRYASNYSETYNVRNPFNWIRISDATQVRGRDWVSSSTNPDGTGNLTQAYDVSTRETPLYGTRAVNTYGTRKWVSVKDPEYSGWADNGGRALKGPLSSDYNVIQQYRTSNDQVSVGSHILFDVTTLGNYYSMGARLEIIPTYYAVGLQRNGDGTTETNFNLTDSRGFVTLTPLDVYQMSSAGEYAEVNIFGAPYGSMAPDVLDSFNRYRLDVNWENEAVTNFNRRNVSAREVAAAIQYIDTLREPLYDEANWDAYHDGDTEVLEPPYGYVESYRQWPRGIMPIGGSQLISQGYDTQTYIGSNMTYGVDKSGGMYVGLSGDALYTASRYLMWEVSAQRWHTTLGLPSDSVFVPLGHPCSCGHCADYELCSTCQSKSGCSARTDYTHTAKENIQTKAIDISKTTVIVYLDIFAYGDVWTLRYGADGLQRSITIEGVEYLLPTTGPAGPGQAHPYTGDSSGGSEFYNPGIPFVLFGGSKVPEMADIIKVN